VTLIAVASALASLLGVWVDQRPAAAEASAHSYVVNTLAFNDATATCDGAGVCTLKKALELANALPADDTAAISVDPNIAIPNANAPYIDVSSVASTGWMCPSSCVGVEGDGSGAVFKISHSGVTIDLGGIIGVGQKAEAPNAATIWIGSGASNVTLRNFNGLWSSETAIVLNNASGVLIENGSTLQTAADQYHNYNFNAWWTERFLGFAGPASDVTLRNWNLGNLYPALGMIAVTGSGSVSGLVLDNLDVKLGYHGTCATATPAGCQANFFYVAGAQRVQGLEIKNCRFHTDAGDAYTYHLFDWADAALDTVKSQYGFWIHDNQFTDIPSGDTSDATLVLPLDEGYSYDAGVYNRIANNRFITTAARNGAALYWNSNRAANSTVESRLVIEDNYFDGYAAATQGVVTMYQTGLVTFQRNTFGTRSSHQATTATEETATTTAMFVNYDSAANKKIRTWYPTAATAAWHAGGCKLDVTLAKPTGGEANEIPAEPVTIDAYWTSGATAERHLGRQTGVTGTTATIPVPEELLNDDGTLNGYLRFQTHSEAYGQLSSSQYSRVITSSGVCAPADFSIEKLAYADAGHTEPLADGAVLQLGARVHFVYKLTNLSDTDETTIEAVVDDALGEEPVCEDVNLLPGQVDATTCLAELEVGR
jgi:hypothetical protein